MSYCVWSTTKSAFRPGRDHERRDARPRPELVVRPGVPPWPGGGTWSHCAAELVVGDDHHRVLLAVATFDELQQRRRGGRSLRLARVPGVLVLGPERLHEADRLQRARLRLPRGVEGREERLLVLEMRTAGRPRRVVREVRERLVVELEGGVRALREGVARVRIVVRVRARGPAPVRPARAVDEPGCVRPAARVPRPVDALRGQAVADRRVRLRDELLAEGPERLGTRAASC